MCQTSSPQKSKPDNCEFVIGNITETLPYKDDTFDFIHQRILLVGLANSNWDKVSLIQFLIKSEASFLTVKSIVLQCLKELLRVLKSGGYIEIIDVGVAFIQFIYLHLNIIFRLITKM